MLLRIAISFIVSCVVLFVGHTALTAPAERHLSQLPSGFSEKSFAGVDNLDDYAALHLREGESAQEFFFDDLMGLEPERVEEGYRFRNEILDLKNTVLDEELINWADMIGARSYLIDDGSGGLFIFRNSFHSSKPGDPQIGSSAFYTLDDTNLCGYIAVSYLHNGLTGGVTLSPMEIILAQTILPAGRGLTTFFPALPPLALHLGGITPRDLSIVANVVLKGTGYATERVTGSLSDTELEDHIQANLDQGLPLIAFVNIVYEGSSNGFRADVSGTLSPEGTYGHFVVVTGFAENDAGETFYRIRNPYDNRLEYYSAEDFLSSVVRSDDLEYGGSLIRTVKEA